jgi:hypothetical protein
VRLAIRGGRSFDLLETVTVTAESPLIETSQSNLSGNIDPRRVTELPSQGRNWMSLAPGARQPHERTRRSARGRSS